MSRANKMMFASVIALLTFVVFAGITAQSVSNMSDLISRSSFSNEEGIPKHWEGTDSYSAVSVNTEVRVDGDHLAYLTSIENKSTTEDLFLTDIASKISDSKHAGFVAFSSDSLEYSYSKNNPESWQKIEGTNEDGSYQFNDGIHIGVSGTSSSKVYLRYNLSPEIGNVTDKISFHLLDAYGNYGVAVSDSAIAYEETNTEIVAVENSRGDDNSGESAFAEPLGVFSESSDLLAVSTSSATMAAISPEGTVASTIIIIATLGLFVGSLIAFLVFRNYKKS